MTDATSAPDPDQKPTGTFVGGAFGTAPEESHNEPQEGSVVAAAGPAPDPTDEPPTETQAPADVEGR